MVEKSNYMSYTAFYYIRNPTSTTFLFAILCIFLHIPSWFPIHLLFLTLFPFSNSKGVVTKLCTSPQKNQSFLTMRRRKDPIALSSGCRGWATQDKVCTLHFFNSIPKLSHPYAPMNMGFQPFFISSFHMRQHTYILSFSNYFFQGSFSTSQLLWIFPTFPKVSSFMVLSFSMCVGAYAFDVFQTCFLWIFSHFSNIYCLDFSNILEGLELYSF